MQTHSAAAANGQAGGPVGASTIAVGVDKTGPVDGATASARLPRSEARDTLDVLLTTLIERGGSDLHLTVGAPPTIRINGQLLRLNDYAPLTPSDTVRLVRSVVTPEQWLRFETAREFDMAYSVPGLSRFRVNLFQQRGSYGAVLRAIPFEIKPLAELGVPPQVETFAHMPSGLVLVAGPTGAGKTTTLASLLDVANRTRADHIMTIEDPIEFIHEHKRCVVNQREVGEDTDGFATALKHVLRQDPDIILVGELRDLETVSTAITAAETGHLVLATLHTQSAAQTVDRIVDIFPPHRQQEIRTRLSATLQGVVTQSLVQRSDGQGRTVVCEVMFTTTAVRSLIREGRNQEITAFMQSSADGGMLTFDQHLAERVRTGLISYEVGLEVCHTPEEYKRLTGRL